MSHCTLLVDAPVYAKTDVGQFYMLPHIRQSGETMTSVSAGHIILKTRTLYYLTPRSLVSTRAILFLGWDLTIPALHNLMFFLSTSLDTWCRQCILLIIFRPVLSSSQMMLQVKLLRNTNSNHILHLLSVFPYVYLAMWKLVLKVRKSYAMSAIVKFKTGHFCCCNCCELV